MRKATYISLGHSEEESDRIYDMVFNEMVKQGLDLKEAHADYVAQETFKGNHVYPYYYWAAKELGLDV